MSDMTKNDKDKNGELFDDLFDNDPILGSEPKKKTQKPKVKIKEQTPLEKFFDKKEEDKKAVKKDSPIFLPIPSVEVILKKVKNSAGKEIEREIRQYTGESVVMELSTVSGEQFLDWLKKHYPEDMLAGAHSDDFNDYKRRKTTFDKISKEYFDKAYPKIFEKGIQYKN